MTKRSAVIADLHLQEGNSHTLAIFERYINEIAVNLEKLFIIGDLFEYWIGDDNLSKFNLHIIDLLSRLSKSTEVYFLAGNRDFMIGEKFLTMTGCKSIPEITSLNIYGKNILLTHGDLLLTKDKKYQRSRKIWQNKITKSIFMMLPLDVRVNFANSRRERSKKDAKNQDYSVFAVDTGLIRSIIKKYNSDIFIYGHIHKTSVSYIQEGIVISLPDWNDNNGSSLVISSDGSVCLENNW